MDVPAFALALLAAGAGVLAPGALAVRALDLGATRLERWVLAVALGRFLLAAVALVGIQTGAPWLPPLFGAAALAMFVAAALRDGIRSRIAPGRSGGQAERGDLLAVILPAAAALLLVVSVVGRSAVVDAAGDLVFLGTDATYDPLFYVATSSQLAARGLPLANPYAADFPMVGHYVFYAVVAGLRWLAGGGLSSGGPWDRLPLEITFRVLPLLDVGALALGASALVRRLGGSPLGGAIGGVAALLAGHVATLAGAALAAIGLPFRDVLAWAMFGPLLLPVNPATPALHTWFAALLLLATPTPGRVAPAVVAGLLVAGLSELKIFLWAPVLGGLVLAALTSLPRRATRTLRIATAVALAGSLPSMIEKIAFARGEGARFDVGFGLCPGCFPRHLLDVTFAGGEFGFGIFERFAWSDLAAPSALPTAVAASVAFLALALGARLVVVPFLLRAVRDTSAPERAAVWRVLALAGVSGAGLALGVGAAPHYLNGGQFLWAGSVGAAIPLGLVCGAWLADGRRLLVVLVLALALATPARELVVQAWGAPPWTRVTAAERALMRELALGSAPDEVVLEPSWLDHADRPSLVPALAARRVVITTSSTAAYLPSWERLFRLQNVERVYTTTDRSVAIAAAEAVGAELIWAPAHRPLRVEPGPGLLLVARNEAGAIYRVAREVP